MLFLPKKMKIDKCQKLVCNLYDKDSYVMHLRALKQALDHGLILEKLHRLIEFRKETWLKSYIDINAKFGIKAKNVLEKDFFKLMNNSVFGKTTEKARKDRDIKLASTDRKKSLLAAEPNCHTRKWFSENLLALEVSKA